MGSLGLVENNKKMKREKRRKGKGGVGWAEVDQERNKKRIKENRKEMDGSSSSETAQLGFELDFT